MNSKEKNNNIFNIKTSLFTNAKFNNETELFMKNRNNEIIFNKQKDFSSKTKFIIPIEKIKNNFQRNHFKITKTKDVISRIVQKSSLLDNNMITEINNIIQQAYSFYIMPKKTDKTYLSDIISHKIYLQYRGQ